MAKNKTKPTQQSVTVFINGIEDKQKRADSKKVAAKMRRATDAKTDVGGLHHVRVHEVRRVDEKTEKL